MHKKVGNWLGYYLHDLISLILNLSHKAKLDYRRKQQKVETKLVLVTMSQVTSQERNVRCVAYARRCVFETFSSHAFVYRMTRHKLFKLASSLFTFHVGLKFTTSTPIMQECVFVIYSGFYCKVNGLSNKFQ